MGVEDNKKFYDTILKEAEEQLSPRTSLYRAKKSTMNSHRDARDSSMCQRKLDGRTVIYVLMNFYSIHIYPLLRQDITFPTSSVWSEA